jgi:hypothetical protein
MATDSKLVTQYRSQIASYWNFEKPASFYAWNRRVVACLEQTEKARIAAIQNISVAFQAPLEKRNVRPVLDAEWQVFRESLATLRQIEKDIEPAVQLTADACHIAQRDKSSSLPGDYISFDRRLDGLRIDIYKIFKNSLYPFLLTLQNAESGWDPAKIVCTAWDYISWWRVVDPEKAINQVCPKGPNNGSAS